METEVRAAHNVLEACAQTDAMERVVFTSSVTAVVWSGHKEGVVDEKSWSDLAFCRKVKVRTQQTRASHTGATCLLATVCIVFSCIPSIGRSQCRPCVA